MKRTYYACAMAALLIQSSGCTEQSAPPAPARKPAPLLSDLPVTLTVTQRSTTVVPGSAGALRLTIDDITRGQVIVSLLDKQGEAELAPTSLKQGEMASFALGAETYQLKLAELRNSLVGKDSATFIISSGSNAGTNGAPARGLTEAERIERLLSELEPARGDVFIRNGVEYTGKDAVEHLRTKLKAAGDKIATAEEFIDCVAAASSLTGEPYRVRLANGTEVLAAEYLREKLARLESDQRGKRSPR